MMDTGLLFFLIVLCYLSVLFGIAYFAEVKGISGRSIVSNPYVYSLSLAVYCTSWTFYGSVGKAATSGLSFITIYLGPTLMAALWWNVLRKIVLTAKENRITTISDFIGSRYGKSLSLSAVVTVIALVGITPYLGLQMKAVMGTFDIMSGRSAGSLTEGWVIALVVGVFAVIFGARRLDASERHEGLVLAVAFESVIKLVAFLSVGALVTYGIFDGFSDIFGRVAASPYSGLVSLGGGKVGYMEWFSLTFLSMMAVLFLPRQFHIAVVENSDVSHIKKAMWLFPLYLLLINVFVLPVAFGGLLLGGGQAEADNFVLTIPLSQGNTALALLVFLGGLSAATGMIIVESLALSTMVMNSLVMPALFRFNRLKGFPVAVLNIKRLVIIGCVFLGYFFAAYVGEFYTLVDMGLKSFEAVTLFAPCLLIGLYWKRGNAKGAVAGLVAGFAVWLYTLLLPALAKAGVIADYGSLGPLFGSPLMDPTALLGVTGLDKWTHSLMWSMLVNLLLYVGVSLATTQSADDRAQSLLFVDSYSPATGQAASGFGGVEEVEELLAQYVGPRAAGGAVSQFLAERGLGRDGLGPESLAELKGEAEKILSGSLGAPISSLIMRERLVLDKELSSSIMQMTDRLRLSREELEDANSELSLLKEFSQNIIESVPVGIATLDGRLNVTYWNREMARITGISRTDAVASPVGTLGICLKQGMFDWGIKGGEYTCDGAGPEKATLKVTVSPFHDPQGGYVLLFEDITMRLVRERELLLASKHASIGKLTAGISHEIGNPLASISSLVQEIQAVDSPEFTKDALGMVNTHIGRIVRIVRSLGDFTRLKSAEKMNADLNRVLDDTLNLTSFDKKFRKVEVEKVVSDVPPVRLNPDQLQQVFLNLILNALDAMPDGGRITISISGSDGWVTVVFRDTGEGMDKETIEKVFDPFYTTKPPGKGTGLGMSICYGIIKDHGGSITVESEKGRGTAFTIKLPVEGN